MSIELIGGALLGLLVLFLAGFGVGLRIGLSKAEDLKGHIDVLQEANDALTGTIAALRERLSRAALSDDEFDRLFPPQTDPAYRDRMYGPVPERGGAEGDGVAGAGEPDQGVDQDGVADPLP